MYAIVAVVNVDDINDNAPRLVNSFLEIQENSPAAKLGDLVAIDADDYSKGKFIGQTYFTTLH